MTAVELHSATKVFSETETTITVDLRADRGRRLVILGPSGSGKTTAMRLVAGLLQPDSGDVTFDGRSMNGVPPEQRRAAMVFQSHALFPFNTVAENVAYGLKVRKVAKTERRERAEQALSEVRLSGYGDRWPSELSGGERQRVALARAVVVEPDVLLLDEPLSSLDPILREELQQLVCEIQERQEMTTIFVTHDRQEARVVGQEVAVMLGGRVSQTGSVDEVFGSPTTPEVARFLGESPVEPNLGRS